MACSLRCYAQIYTFHLTFAKTSLAVIEDLAKLEISDKDLYGLMRAKVKESNIKLTEADIARIRVATGPSPYFSPKLKAKLAAEYKQILFDKARQYAKSDETALDLYTDQEEAVSARDALTALVKSQAIAAGRNPRFYSLLSQSPRDAAQNSESLVFPDLTGIFGCDALDINKGYTGG